MNPLTREILISLLVRAVGTVCAILVANDMMTQEQVNGIDATQVAGAIVVAGSFLYGVWHTYTSRRKVVTSIAHPDIDTEAKLERAIKDGQAASTMTPKTDIPVPMPPKA